MNRIDLVNLAAALLVLALASLAVNTMAPTRMAAPSAAPPSTAGAAQPRTAGAAPATIRDANDTAVPVGHYARIVSASMIADAVLPDLIPAQRIIMVTEAHRQDHPQAFRTAHAAVLPHRAGLEAILPLRPDLLLVSNTTGDPERVERARSMGIVVCDLGPMQGRDTLLTNIRRLGQLLMVPERGEALATQLADRLDRLPLHIPPAQRLRGLYLAAYGSQIYGGTVGSSYHDVLIAAGLIDVAAGAFPAGQGWPQLRLEDLLRLQPRILVTPRGGAERLRALPGLDALDSRIVEVDGQLLGDPSLMLPAAEALQQAVYTGRPSAPAGTSR